MRLILVRHPKPLCEPGLCYGRLDLECDATALEQAALHLQAVASSLPIVSSPARRASDLALRLSADATLDSRLQELDFGAWEGKRWQDIGPGAIETWQRGLPDSAPQDGESLTALSRRCAAWLSSLEPSGGGVLAITHAGPIRVIRALLGRIPLLSFFSDAVPFAEPITLECDWNRMDDHHGAQDMFERMR